MAEKLTACFPNIHVFMKAFCTQLAICLTALICAFPQSPKLNFEFFSTDQGLLIPMVSDVIQDRTGYLWLANGGLVRYDGYNFTAFRRPLENTGNPEVTRFITLYEDKQGIIWGGTYQGLERFDPQTGIFTHYTPHKKRSGTEWSNRVLSILEDSHGIFWVGTADGLNKFNKSDGTFTTLYADSSDPGSISNNSINKIHEDRKGNIWFGTGGGLDRLDQKTGKFVHYWHDPVNQTPYDDWGNSKYWIKTICEDEQGILWLGSYGGLIRFDPENVSYAFFQHNSENAHGIHGSKINSIAEDASGVLWICLADSGIDSFDRKANVFTHYYRDAANPVSPGSNRTNSVLCERSGTIWFSTESGIIKLNRPRETFKKYLQGVEIENITCNEKDRLFIKTAREIKVFDPKREKFLPFPTGNDYLFSQDKDGNLWLAKKNGGIYKRDPEGHITLFYDPSGHEFNKRINSFFKSENGTIWLGTPASGLYFIDPVVHYVRQKDNFKTFINQIYEDRNGLLWIATDQGGLLCYRKGQDSAEKYYSDIRKTAGINLNTVLNIYEDKKGTIWLATPSGLVKFNRSANTFTAFSEEAGLATFVVLNILEDDHGNLWISTAKGISKFDPVKERFRNYDVSDGLPNGGFSDIMVSKSANGEMYFGGSDGFVRFHPDSIKDNLFHPPIVITSFLKFDKPFIPEKEVKLSHNDNFLSFEFAALSFISPERNQYAYKMEGLDKDWIYSGSRRYVSYPDLSPGEYTFRVKGSNNDGMWNESGASIKIIIFPPWWKTWWAYALYAGLILTGFYSLRRYELNREAWKNQVKLDEVILREKEEADKMKSRFFANISHEFRTPLTLIQGPADKIISRSADEVILHNANLIKRNSSRLLQLINQLLDLSKIEAGKLKLEVSKGNIVSFVKGVALSFESLSESKTIMLKFHSEKEFIELYFDKEKMVKVFTNIISNAFKFTPEEGRITISIRESVNSEGRQIAEIKIRDTGIGVAPEELPKLFDRFYQADSSHTREYEGTGIGLALTKELIEMHGGTISVQSRKAGTFEDKSGFTEFTIELLKGRDHLKDEEIISADNKASDEMKTSADHDSSLQKNISAEFTDDTDDNIPEDRTVILIVEDNYDMREYIKDSLAEENYLIEEAVNGEQGVKKAIKIIPDLIICDMMMPKMDGNELTRILKNDEKTSHIPVILLTARSGQENKLEGLKSGADDYLTKPFDIKELRIRIINLIQIRRRLQDKFGKGGLPSSKQDDNRQPRLKPIDEEFIKKIMQVIEKHISDEEFSIEEFSSEAGMSRTQLHRKLKALTGKSASLYLRSVRLQRAKKMIEEQKGNISEIAYSVGFSSPAYFSRCFKEEFGYTPSEVNQS